MAPAPRKAAGQNNRPLLVSKPVTSTPTRHPDRRGWRSAGVDFSDEQSLNHHLDNHVAVVAEAPFSRTLELPTMSAISAVSLLSVRATARAPTARRGATAKCAATRSAFVGNAKAFAPLG